MNDNLNNVNDYAFMEECLKESNIQIMDLQNKIEEYKWLDDALIKRTVELDKKTRALDCIYNISSVLKENRINSKLVFRLIAELIPDGFNDPDSVCAEIKLNEHIFTSKKHFTSKVLILNEIKIFNTVLGSIVVYLNNPAGNFTPDETKLAEQITYITSLFIKNNILIKKSKSKNTV